MAKSQRTPEERFWSKVRKSDAPDGCWMWMGGKTKGGYGVFRVGSILDGTRRQIGAHVFACELAHGPLKLGEEAHHVCRNHACVRGDHLEPRARVDHLAEHSSDLIEHGKRAASHPNFVGASALARSRLTSCQQGHPFDEVNTYRDKKTGERGCRSCRKAAGVRWRIRNGQRVTAAIRLWLENIDREAAAYRSQS